MVVGHPQDEELARTVEGYRALLANEDSLRVWTLDRVVAAARCTVASSAQTMWLNALETRYLRLDLSEEEWYRHRARRWGR